MLRKVSVRLDVPIFTTTEVEAGFTLLPSRRTAEMTPESTPLEASSTTV